MPFIALSGNSQTISPNSDFITVRNGRFERGSKPYYYIGTNLWYGCYLGDA